MKPDELNKLSAYYELMANLILALGFIAMIVLSQLITSVYLAIVASLGLTFQLAYLFTVPIFLTACANWGEATNAQKKKVICMVFQYISGTLFAMSLVTLILVMINGL